MTIDDSEKTVQETSPREEEQPVDENGAPESVEEKLTAERDDWKNRAARAMADLENYRRRAERDKEEIAAYANQRLVLRMLPVLDNLERAVAAPASDDAVGYREGVDLIIRQFRDVLAKEGVTPIEAVGQPFDPHLHEAVMQVESDEHDEPIVVEEFQKGYRMGERTIRPSVVKVAKKA